MGLETTMLQRFPDEKSIPGDFRIESQICQKGYLIDGQIRQWEGAEAQVLSPVHTRTSAGLIQKVLGSYPLMTEKESMEALRAASHAFDKGRGKWPTMSVEERIACMADFALRIKKEKKEIVTLLMWEIGKTFEDSEKEFDRTITYIEDTIDAYKDMDRVASRFVIAHDIAGQIHRSPLGVVLSMGPFNYPLNETFTTLIPAIITGNTVIVKPPKLGVLLFSRLLEPFRDSFPAGVVNTLYGEGKVIIGPLMKSGQIDVLAFIGTSKVADMLRKQHPKLHRMRCVLGLDAKNPAIVLPDANLDLAVKECILGSLSFNGQRCTAIKILFVHRSVLDRFLNTLTRSIDNLKIGMPWEKGVTITPLPEPGKTGYLSSLVQDAVTFGAKVINKDGGAMDETLFWPAVLCPVNEKMRIYSEEQFGPIIPVCPFDTMEEPVQYMIQSNYGQQVSIFGSDPDTIASLIDPLVNQVCRVNINSQCQRGPDIFPFTGRKDSAEGTLSVSDALRVFTIRSLVAARMEPLNKSLITKIVREHKSKFLSTDFIL